MKKPHRRIMGISKKLREEIHRKMDLKTPGKQKTLDEVL